ncbi:embryogenesis-associated protein EMB8 [Physcomitrium patens]|uniref:AB hydrolase-1 domain-containing protein n=1 Tax=Physcomitrium patens TaxID=3218 RepID=A0A2K1KDT9_PHYPA|nr:embryogenesis-associated protein EMB8-like [Physcomitrium patens]PNR51943.1 hypothetical protein PHYPA_008317 [Physcomitrium patens]|eukprot:XP_024378237.1 embryogenesis-associated protein EMB8-like [Physcomitrella patens]
MLSARVSPILGSCHDARLAFGLVERDVSQLPFGSDLRFFVGAQSKLSKFPGGCSPSAGRGREIRTSSVAFQPANQIQRAVKAQAASELPSAAAASLGVLALIMGGNFSQGKPLEIIGEGAAFNASLLPKLTELEKPYKPYPFLSNRHVETIFAAFFRSLPGFTFRRECLRMADGGTVALDWPQPELQNPKAVLILLPGLTGGSDDTYVQHMTRRARNHGWAVVVFNSRGCADSPVTTAQFYSGSFTEDLRQVVKHAAFLFPSLRIYAAGWSLGANILVRYCGQEGDRCPLSGAVSLCNPFNLVLSNEDFHKGFNKIYNKSLARGLRRIFAKHAHLFKDIGGDYNIPLVEKATTVREFDDGLTRVSFGYKSVDDYYFDASSSRSIKDVKVPLLCIQAWTDPIAPERGIPRADIAANPNCFLVVTPYGGHLGWISGPEAPFGCPWTDPLIMQYLEALEEAGSDAPAFRKVQEDGGDVEVASESSRQSTERPGLME